MKPDRLKRLVMMGICVFLLQGSSCLGIDDVTKALNSAIEMVRTESTKWREALDTLRERLRKDGSDLLADVDVVSQRAIAASGSQVQCVIDFTGTRVLEQLRNLLHKHKNEDEVLLAPYICSAVPGQVNLIRAADERKEITLYGYDLDMNQPSRLRALLVDRSGTTLDISRYISTPSHYMMTLNTALGGVPFTGNPAKVVIELPTNPPKPVSSLSITRYPAVPSIKVFPSTGKKSDNAAASVSVPQDYRLIGGGCRSDAVGAGQLLWASYPLGSTWRCGAKAHAVSDPATVTAFAIGIKETETLDIRITEPVQGTLVPNVAGHHYEAVAQLPAGYSLVGGGCRIGDASWTEWPVRSYQGNYLVVSAADGSRWRCESKDHNGALSDVNVFAYAIGVKSSSDKFLEVEAVQSDSAVKQSANPTMNPIETPTSPWNLTAGVVLVGGSCKVEYDVRTAAGNLLRAAYPHEGTSVWECRSKDHGSVSPATLTALAFGLKYRVP